MLKMSPCTAHVFHGALSHFLYEWPVWWLKEQRKCSKHLNTFCFQSSTRDLPSVLRYGFSTFAKNFKTCGAGKSNIASNKLQLCLERLHARPNTKFKVVKVGLQSPRVVYNIPNQSTPPTPWRCLHSPRLRLLTTPIASVSASHVP
jgi:hypothetical protein